MSRVLTGIQSSGVPHLGNILGAIIPAIELSKIHESFFFIADLHAITTVKDAKTLKENTLSTAAAWLAFGLNTDKNILYRQSDIPQVTELMWYLNCITPYPMLANAHSFKDKADKLSDVNAGLFTYSVLMAADIILYNANIVPVGKDQLQHLEITRDIAKSFNHFFGDTFVIPEAQTKEKHMIIPGIDGQKMSKSYKNYISVLASEKTLKKQIMNIVTDSKSLEEPKDPKSCPIFKLYELITNDPEQINSLRNKYQNGGFGYGHAKNELLELILEKYKSPRLKFTELMQAPEKIEKELIKGAQRANKIADSVIKKVKKNIGLM